MKYKDIPSEKLVQKLLATSFESPTANRDVYDWCDSLLKHIRFLENERLKLIKKYGEEVRGGLRVPTEKEHDFWEEFNPIKDMEINEEIKKCPIQRDWFTDEKCQYPDEKELWISPSEIGILIGNETKT